MSFRSSGVKKRSPARRWSVAKVICSLRFCCLSISAVQLASPASFSAFPASVFAEESSASAIVWRCLEHRKIPASANSSPAHPTAMSTANKSCLTCHQGSLCSPIKPTTTTTANATSAHSDTSRQISVSGLDNETRVPISTPDLLVSTCTCPTRTSGRLCSLGKKEKKVNASYFWDSP